MWLVGLGRWVLLVVRYRLSFLSKAKPDWSWIILRDWMDRELLLISESLKLNTHLCLTQFSWNEPEINWKHSKQSFYPKAKSHSSPYRKPCFLRCWFPKGGFAILPREEAKLNYWCHPEKQDKLYDFWVLFAWSRVENEFSPFAHLWRGLV